MICQNARSKFGSSSIKLCYDVNLNTQLHVRNIVCLNYLCMMMILNNVMMIQCIRILSALLNSNLTASNHACRFQINYPLSDKI